MALEDSELKITVQIKTERTFDVAPGKSIKEEKFYNVTDVYTNAELRNLLTRITPANPVTPPA